MNVVYRAGPAGKGRYVKGYIEIGGVDISNRVQAITIRHDARGGATMRLTMPIYGDDEIAVELPSESVRILRPVLTG